jgi:hypothetical protein
VDQLLTSEFFGLDTTIDPDLDRRFQAYYQLLAIPEESRSEAQREQLRELRAYIQRESKPVLGHTRRDQLVYEAVDDFLKDAGQLDERERKQRRKKVLRDVRKIWEARRALAPNNAGET